jgi:acetyl esterase/lipase
VAAFAAVTTACGHKPPVGVETLEDIVYTRAGGRALRLDLYLPAGPGPWPAIIYLHQGGWHSGDKTAFRRQAEYMAGRGFAGACVEYRLSNEARFPGAVEDAKAAVGWLRANATRYRINAERIGAAGASSGGYLALMIGLDPDTKLRAVVAFNPVIDLVALGKFAPDDRGNYIARFMGQSFGENPGLWEQASPLHHVNRLAPPTLLLHGTEDELIPYEQAVEMQRALEQAGVRAELFSAAGGKHGFYQEPEFYGLTLQKMEEFFASTLK